MKDILQKVDVEKLYQHILTIEGVKHPFANPDKLNETADYILSEFEKYGLETNDQTFELEGIDFPLRNIEGYLGDGSEPELLVTSHYDTVRRAPGANDNGSGVAAMLETARVLAEEGFSGNVRFISFTLEEFFPVIDQKNKEKGLELGIFNQDYNYVSYQTQKKLRKINIGLIASLAKGNTAREAMERAFEEIKDEMSEAEKEFTKFIIESRPEITRTSWIGKTGLVGSSHWVKKTVEEGKKIKGVINLETIGFRSNKKKSQRFPPLMHPIIFPSYKVKARKLIGNFISVISDKNSKELGKAFCKMCKQEGIKLPYLWVKLPLRFEKIAKWAIDTLRADNAPFWRENIPALMITDTADFRYPYYHTEADKIDKLDFDFIRKVTQATIATVLDMS